jgi:CheY-like chemotaxis protein
MASFPGIAAIRVLVVDDNASAREILSDLLKQFSVRTVCVSSGNEAVREVLAADSHDPYGLVLVDWHMPEMNGLETSRVIKHVSGLSNVPKVVITTGFGGEEIPLHAEQLGIEGFLQKPVTPSALLDTLMNLFGAHALIRSLSHRRKRNNLSRGPVACEFCSSKTTKSTNKSQWSCWRVRAQRLLWPRTAVKL